MKTLKKAMAFVLALVMAVTVFYGTDMIMNANAETGTKVVYYDNAKTKWSKVFVYIWDGSQGTQTLKGTKVEGNIYKMEIPADYSKILFKNTQNGWDKQTANTTVPTDKNNCFKPSSSSNKTSGSWYYYEDVNVVTPEPLDYIPVVFNNSNTMWKEAYAYVWNNPEDYAVFEAQEVQDITMWKDEHGGWQQADRYFIYSIPNKYSHILFKNTAGIDNWDKQTVDLNMPTDNNNMFLANMYGVNGEGKYEGTWGPVPTSTPTPTVKPSETPTCPTITPTVKPTKSPRPATATPTVKPTKSPRPATATPTVKPTKSPAVTIVPTKLPENYVKVYYKSSYSSTYIHYVTSTGVWTTVPGDKMSKSGDYAYYVVDLGNRSESKACFNNGSGKWDNNKGNNYTLKSGNDVYIENGSVKYVKHSEDVKVKKIAFRDSAYDDNNNYISWQQKVYAYVWTSPEDYAVFESVQDIESWSKNVWGTWCRHDTFVFEIPVRYTHILFKNINSTTEWDKQTVDYEMPQDDNRYFDKTGVNGEGKYVGVWEKYPYDEDTTPTPTVTPTVTPTTAPDKKVVYFCNEYYNDWSNAYAYVWNNEQDANVFEAVGVTTYEAKNSYKIYKFEIPGNYSNILFKNTAGTVNWDKQTRDLEMPTGEYDLFFYGTGGTGHLQEFWMNSRLMPVDNVTPTPYVEKNVATVYYTGTDKTGSKNWTSKCNIHFKVNGTWTSAPGVKMTAVDSSKAMYVYTIDLGDATEATVCFNNGSGKWDSNDGKNYVVKAGTNYVAGKKVTYGQEEVLIMDAAA